MVVLANIDHQVYSPHGAQKRLAFYYLVRLGIRGRVELHELQRQDIRVETSPNGKDFVWKILPTFWFCFFLLAAALFILVGAQSAFEVNVKLEQVMLKSMPTTIFRSSRPPFFPFILLDFPFCFSFFPFVLPSFLFGEGEIGMDGKIRFAEGTMDIVVPELGQFGTWARFKHVY